MGEFVLCRRREWRRIGRCAIDPSGTPSRARRRLPPSSIHLFDPGHHNSFLSHLSLHAMTFVIPCHLSTQFPNALDIPAYHLQIQTRRLFVQSSRRQQDVKETMPHLLLRMHKEPRWVPARRYERTDGVILRSNVGNVDQRPRHSVQVKKR